MYRRKVLLIKTTTNNKIKSHRDNLLVKIKLNLKLNLKTNIYLIFMIKEKAAPMELNVSNRLYFYQKFAPTELQCCRHDLLVKT